MAELRPIVDVLGRVPDSHRVFTEPRALAVRIHRIADRLLDELVELGLPVRIQGSDQFFDRNDLVNTGLRLGLDSPQRRSLMLLGAALAAGAEDKRIRRTLDIVGRCPNPGHDGACEFTLARWLAEVPDVTAAIAVAPHHLRLELELDGGPERRLPRGETVHALLHSLDDVEFHHLPDALAGDLGFLRETRLADCRLATHHLVGQGLAAGLEVRPAFGVFLAPPMSVPHCWIELRDGGEWRRADPFFLRALAGWGIVDGALWPADREPVGAYWKVADALRAFVFHDGAPLRSSLITRAGDPPRT